MKNIKRILTVLIIGTLVLLSLTSCLGEGSIPTNLYSSGEMDCSSCYGGNCDMCNGTGETRCMFCEGLR